MGITGESVYRLLLQLGIAPHEISTYDDKNKADFHNSADLLEKCQPKTLIVSPGFPLSTPWIQKFVQEGGQITSELSLALEHISDEKIIAVTGALGKSTTVSILESAFLKFSPDSFLGGNIGRPLADYVIALLQNKRKKAPWIVLELSSFQLENIAPLKCDFSVFTYFTGNHLDRYKNIDHYYQTKWSLLARTKQKVVLNKNGGDLRKFVSEKASAEELEKIIWADRSLPLMKRYKLSQAMLLGGHNQDNLALAAAIADLAKWPEIAYEGMKEFPGLPHRMENLGKLRDVLFVNDSKATTMDSVQTAVNSIYEDTLSEWGSLYLLLGGKDKNLPWEVLQNFKKLSGLKPIFFGECAEVAQRKSALQGPVFKTLNLALEALPGLAHADDIVLLSPGGTSLDEFKNFEQRGEFFKNKIKILFG